jgi:hypothetical protein
MQNGKLIFEGEAVHTSSNYGSPDTTATNSMRVEFSFEKNGDLITVPGESYKEAVRFIKQR